MLLLGTDKDLFVNYVDKYDSQIAFIDVSFYRNSQDKDKPYPYNFLEYLKSIKDKFEIIYLDYSADVVAFLNVLKMEYSIIYSVDDSKAKELDYFDSINCNKIVLNDSYKLEDFLKSFNWFKTEPPLIAVDEHRAKTLKDLIEDDSGLTNLDVQDVKQLQNKLKMGVLLQAKSMLNRVLKLTNILDKLYDELLDRVDSSLATSDTASLMYTTKFISDALNDTNQFIMTLVNNEKIQNFFIIDNSTIINTNNISMDSEKREKLRRAAEIVLNNCDYLVDNQFDKIVDPNKAFEDKKQE